MVEKFYPMWNIHKFSYIQSGVEYILQLQNVLTPNELIQLLRRAIKRSTLDWSDIDAIAVTYGPGLAIALEVGINKAKELSAKYKKPLVAVNHMEGHLYSSFVQNSKGNPKHSFTFHTLVCSSRGDTQN
jgi:tRNA A37 threonylcarbamoyltransferase TsaD